MKNVYTCIFILMLTMLFGQTGKVEFTKGRLIPKLLNYQGYLTDTIYESWVPEGIPDEIDVAHKFGRELHVVNDAGIVFAEEPFVLVIVSKGVVEREADEIFPELARLVFDVETEE